MQSLDQSEFAELMRQVEHGDAGAAAKLVEQFEPEIRREIRIRLTDPRLRRVVDSIDICQSVLGNFFGRANMGQLSFDHPNQLFRFLTTMARNKIIDRYRKEDIRNKAIGNYMEDHEFDEIGEPMDSHTSPDVVLESKEMLNRAFSELTEDEKRIAVLRQKGKSWMEIAEEVGSSATSLRKKLSRACNRIMGSFDIGESPGDC